MSSITIAQSVKKGEERSIWINIFDPASSPELKSQLEARLRANVEAVVLQDRERGECKEYISKRLAQDSIKILPSGTTAAFVMTAGYHHINVYSYFNEISKSKRFVFIGYSSGRHSSDKEFKDGTSMTGKVFITERDLQTIQKDVSTPILLLDEFKASGATFAAIGNALKRQLGYTGELFQAEAICGINRWDGVIAEGTESQPIELFRELAKNVPILTELRTGLTSMLRM